VPGWPAWRGTLAAPVRRAGRGLHTGRRCQVVLHPAAAGHGVVFQRRLKGGNTATLPARLDLRLGQPLCTALRTEEGIVIRTTEHLLAALRACGIDDALVELDAEELPILDGSAQPWIAALLAAGRRELPVPQRFIQVIEPVEWADGPHRLRVEPTSMPGLELDVTMTMKDVGEWHWQGTLTPELFRREIAAARSFGRVKLAIPAMLYGLARGLPILRGAGPWCAATIVGRRVIGGTRMPDEFVRHKIVDMLGDFALLGAPLLGRVTALRPTHDGNYGLMTALMRKKTAWHLVEVDPALAV
jgi:UDP-3-O-[3-hydroxymyristoyl] N-acetylglucosamine deacetylase